jgi:hypothetical protein
MESHQDTRAVSFHLLNCEEEDIHDELTDIIDYCQHNNNFASVFKNSTSLFTPSAAILNAF